MALLWLYKLGASDGSASLTLEASTTDTNCEQLAKKRALSTVNTYKVKNSHSVFYSVLQSLIESKW